MHTHTRHGFTLIEVQIAALVLLVGIAATLSLVLTGMAWGQEVRRNTLAMVTARTALVDPLLIDPAADLSRPDTIAGRVNGFYVVRASEDVLFPS
ncbi:MAG: type IV pilus modification PilV family protein, partial [Planctomycetota bacterium]